MPDYVFVSDLHLSLGRDPCAGRYDANEDFLYDSQFARFLAYLQQRGVEEAREWTLVLLGDTFDFLQVRDPERELQQPDTSAETTSRRLRRIAQGHAGFFRALAEWLRAGHRLDVVAGNHDIELVWPEVQRTFIELLNREVGRKVQGQVTFHPWIYHVPGLLYAEHGQQYDGSNSFETLVEPYQPDRPSQIDLPLGSYSVHYMFNRLSSIDPSAKYTRPAGRYIVWALRTHPILTLRSLRAYVRFIDVTLSRTGLLTEEEQIARRAEYRETALPGYAASAGLSHETVTRIDELAALPAMSGAGHLLKTLFVDRMASSLPVVGALITLWLATDLLRRRERKLLWSLGLLLALAWRERSLLHPSAAPSGYLQRAAYLINRMLSEEGKAVPYYLFGHTHEPELVPINGTDAAYINTGTWTVIAPSAWKWQDTREAFTFVEITTDGAKPHARLMEWNDSAQEARPCDVALP